MFARFMRFYPAYRLEDIMSMRAKQFFALNAQIRRLSAEEEAKALAVTHNGKPADRLKELHEEIRTGKTKAGNVSSVGLINKGEAVAGNRAEIEAERERQRLAAEEIKKDPQAWLEKLKAQQAQAQASEQPSQSG